jgi:hypothetical protein
MPHFRPKRNGGDDDRAEEPRAYEAQVCHQAAPARFSAEQAGLFSLAG